MSATTVVNADTARYVLSAGAQAVAAVFGLVVTVTFVVSQAGRYRIPASLLTRLSFWDALFYGTSMAGILAPLTILYLEEWSLTWLALVIVSVAVVSAIPFTRSRHLFTRPTHYLQAASKRPDAILELAMQALENGDYEVFQQLMNSLANADTPSVPVYSSVNPLAIGFPSSSYAMAQALPWILLNPRFPRGVRPAVQAVASAIMNACSPQNQGTLRPFRFMRASEGANFARSNPNYSAQHLNALSNLDIGFGYMSYGLMGQLLPEVWPGLALQLIHDIMVLWVAGDRPTDSERNALWGLRDSLARDHGDALPTLVDRAIAVDDNDPLPVDHAQDYYYEYMLAWNRVTLLFIREGVGLSSTLWPWFVVNDDELRKTQLSAQEALLTSEDAAT